MPSPSPASPTRLLSSLGSTPPPTACRPQKLPTAIAGFTLVESLVALAIVGLTLLGVLSSIWHYRLAGDRLAAQRSALRTLEAAHETLRAGEAPLESGPFVGVLSIEPGAVPRAIEIEVERTMRPGLRRVTLRCRYQLRGHFHEQVLETQFWRP